MENWTEEQKTFYSLRDSDWLDELAVSCWLYPDSNEQDGLSFWKVSKKGNLWCQEFGATYTVLPTAHGFYRGVVIAKGGQRVNIPEQESPMAILELMWPEGDLTPLLGSATR